MRIYLIVFSLIFAGAATASIQTSASQDKPPRLYVKSYIENYSHVTEDTESSDGWPEGSYELNWSVSDNCSWTDGSAGNFSWSFYFTVAPDFISHNVTISWPRTSWENVYNQLTWHETSTTTLPPSTGAGNFTNDYSPYYARVPVFLEHCDLRTPLVDNSCDTYPIFSGIHVVKKATGARTAETVIKLQTGGGSKSKLRNLFRFMGSATTYTAITVSNQNYGGYYDWLWEMPNEFGRITQLNPTSTNVPVQNIRIGSYGNLGSDGKLYKILPDNADVDVTPIVGGSDYYSFNVTQQKYHSYFDVYVLEADPSGLLPYSIEHDVGHAWWGLRTDAPTDATSFLHQTNQWFLVKGTYGYYPTNEVTIPLYCPGQLYVPESKQANDATIKRSFYIGYDDLIVALGFTRGLYGSPGTYELLGHNCVMAVKDAAVAAGGHAMIPGGSPQSFGKSLAYMYPTNITISRLILP